ncbi:hypothetical protein M0812_16845 [Anaeramoeba flamelloides]|uniref:Uncharacterized protein n=1 Tax=Anaeramoeba flamelloides TaxID=1746091 RepID=A0AAV7ZD49_9EUKA|nr:hypothetical protein M0812_16845 [Anaeramoeba flamelloides]
MGRLNDDNYRYLIKILNLIQEIKIEKNVGNKIKWKKKKDISKFFTLLQSSEEKDGRITNNKTKDLYNEYLLGFSRHTIKYLNSERNFFLPATFILFENKFEISILNHPKTKYSYNLNWELLFAKSEQLLIQLKLFRKYSIIIRFNDKKQLILFCITFFLFNNYSKKQIKNISTLEINGNILDYEHELELISLKYLQNKILKFEILIITSKRNFRSNLYLSNYELKIIDLDTQNNKEKVIVKFKRYFGIINIILNSKSKRSNNQVIIEYESLFDNHKTKILIQFPSILQIKLFQIIIYNLEKKFLKLIKFKNDYSKDIYSKLKNIHLTNKYLYFTSNNAPLIFIDNSAISIHLNNTLFKKESGNVKYTSLLKKHLKKIISNKKASFQVALINTNIIKNENKNGNNLLNHTSLQLNFSSEGFQLQGKKDKRIYIKMKYNKHCNCYTHPIDQTLFIIIISNSKNFFILKVWSLARRDLLCNTFWNFNNLFLKKNNKYNCKLFLTGSTVNLCSGNQIQILFKKYNINSIALYNSFFNFEKLQSTNNNNHSDSDSNNTTPTINDNNSVIHKQKLKEEKRNIVKNNKNNDHFDEFITISNNVYNQKRTEEKENNVKNNNSNDHFDNFITIDMDNNYLINSNQYKILLFNSYGILIERIKIKLHFKYYQIQFKTETKKYNYSYFTFFLTIKKNSLFIILKLNKISKIILGFNNLQEKKQFIKDFNFKKQYFLIKNYYSQVTQWYKYTCKIDQTQCEINLFSNRFEIDFIDNKLTLEYDDQVIHSLGKSNNDSTDNDDYDTVNNQIKLAIWSNKYLHISFRSKKEKENFISKFEKIRFLYLFYKNKLNSQNTILNLKSSIYDNNNSNKLITNNCKIILSINGILIIKNFNNSNFQLYGPYFPLKNLKIKKLDQKYKINFKINKKLFFIILFQDVINYNKFVKRIKFYQNIKILLNNFLNNNSQINSKNNSNFLIIGSINIKKDNEVIINKDNEAISSTYNEIISSTDNEAISSTYNEAISSTYNETISSTDNELENSDTINGNGARNINKTPIGNINRNRGRNVNTKGHNEQNKKYIDNNNDNIIKKLSNYQQKIDNKFVFLILMKLKNSKSTEKAILFIENDNIFFIKKNNTIYSANLKLIQLFKNKNKPKLIRFVFVDTQLLISAYFYKKKYQNNFFNYYNRKI